MVITTGTVNSISAVGYCVGQFTLRKTAALKPTTAARTLDVGDGRSRGGLGECGLANDSECSDRDHDLFEPKWWRVSLGAVGSVTAAGTLTASERVIPLPMRCLIALMRWRRG